MGADGAWLDANLIRLRDLHADSLVAIMGRPRVVAFSEVTHGSREVMTSRQTLLETLVLELGFRVLAIEANRVATSLLNEYVVSGTGDPADLIAGLGSPMWDTHEFRASVDWLRAHNARSKSGETVQLWGVDILTTERTRDAAISAVHRRLPSIAREMDAISAALTQADRDHTYESVKTDILRLEGDLRSEQGGLGERLARELAAEELRNLGRWISSQEATGDEPDDGGTHPSHDRHHDDPPPAFFERSRQLAVNLLEQMADNDDDVVLWAHSAHVAYNFRQRDGSKRRTMGSYLQDALATRYFCICTEVGGGTYLARAIESGGGELRVEPIPEPPADSIPARLSEADAGGYLLGFRGSATRPGPHWIKSIGLVHSFGWNAPERPQVYTTMVLGDDCDAVLFLPLSSPTSPTTSHRAGMGAGSRQ